LQRLESCGLKAEAAPTADLQLQKRFSTLGAGGGLGAVTNEASEPAEPKPHSSTRRKYPYVCRP